jgi:hypothetical protein
MAVWLRYTRETKSVRNIRRVFRISYSTTVRKTSDWSPPFLRCPSFGARTYVCARYMCHKLTNITLLEKLPLVKLVKNFAAFYGTRKFIIVFTRALCWSIFWARSIQFIPPNPISLTSVLILSTHLRLGPPTGPFLLAFPPISYMHSASLPVWAKWPSHFIRRDLIILIILGEVYKLWSSSLCRFLLTPVTSPLFGPKYSPQRPVFKHPQSMFLP